MSAKWRRVQAWDREHLTGPLAPVRVVLHALSTVTLAVCLLVGVAVYAVLASVPIGLLALGLTWVVYGITLVLAAVIPAIALSFVARKVTRSRTPRFLATLVALVAGAGGGTALWFVLAWPAMHYDPATGEGLRLFAGFVETYRAVTLRRLPAFEMTELEFYAWIPMKIMLGVFMLNMIVATIRRIEFRFVNLGVLTVHTGIVTIALGSIYYQSYKQEGDTILLAGNPQNGQPLGPPQQTFYDREDPALMVFDGSGWRQLPLAGRLPRYNDYNLKAGAERSAKDDLGFGSPIDTTSDDGRTLDIDLTASASGVNAIPDGVTLRVIGYASYADAETDWVPAPGQPGGAQSLANPLRMVYLVDNEAQAKVGGTGRLVGFAMMPEQPEFAAVEYAGVVGVDYVVDMDEARWAAISTPTEPGSNHLVIVRLPETGARLVIPSDRPGRTHTIGGWTVVVEQVLPEPPFPIITAGYEGATSALAVVRVTPPSGETFRRWVYHRFPQIDQDLTDEQTPDGRPQRSDPDPRIEMHYIDQSKLQLYVNESSETGEADIVFRHRDGMDTASGLASGDRYQTPIDRIAFDFGDRWDAAREIERPSPVPEIDREGDFIGTHDRAMIAVEVGVPEQDWTQTVWLPFSRYAHDTETRAGSQRTVTLPNGVPISFMFGRQWFSLPGFRLRLIDFEMIAYDHRGAPRDYQSLVRVEPSPEDPAIDTAFDHITRLNSPLKAPFLWSDSRGFAANVAGELVSHLSPRQYKFSQAGWDRSGWDETQAQVDAGLLERPRVRFTILGVGNNPGIHVIALGGVLMGVGTPWAFYVKPWLLRRKKKKIQAQLAREAERKQPAPSDTAHPVGAAT